MRRDRVAGRQFDDREPVENADRFLTRRMEK